MSSKQFLLLVAIGLLLAAVLTIAFNTYMDIFALFRPVQGRTISIYGEERIAKYLHSFRYIPEAFDGVLLGSSVSENMDVKNFAGYRLYNASIDGGNVVDLQPIVDNIYRKRDLSLTLICVHRYLTKDHDRKTDFMMPRQYWGALGSPQLLTAYISSAAARRGVVQNLYDDAGTLHFGGDTSVKTAREKIDQTVIDINQGKAAVGNYYIDPVALADLNEVIEIARHHSKRLVIFYPPTPAPVLAACATQYSHYRDTINGLTQPGDIVVDFNGPDYEKFRSDYANFIDGVHLSSTGAKAVMAELSKITQRSVLVGRQNLQ